MASTLLVLGGLLFMMHALRGQLSDLSTVAIAVHPSAFPVLALLATLTMLTTASLHATIVARIASTPIDPARVRYAYAASQVARYVPGKVFGVILEAQMLAPALSTGQVITATVLQTLLAYAWAGAVSVITLGMLSMDSVWLSLLAPAVLALLWLAQRNRWMEYMYSALRAGANTMPTPAWSTESSRRSALQSTLLLAIQWLPFFAIWILLAAAEHGVGAAAWLGASYLLASIGGSILVLIPSGLVVREAAFVWLGGLQGLPVPSLLAWAVVVRLVLTSADLLAVLILWIVLRLRGRS